MLSSTNANILCIFTHAMLHVAQSVQCPSVLASIVLKWLSLG